MTDTAVRDTIVKVWELTDNAENDAACAARSLDVLTALVVAENLNDGTCNDLDIDAFATFTEGIKALICQIADEAGKAANLTRDLKKAMRTTAE